MLYLKRNNRIQRLLCIFICSVMFFSVILQSATVTKVNAADEYDELREKYKTKLTGYDPSDPYNTGDANISAYITGLDEIVNQYWSSMNGSYTWDDVQQSSATSSADMNTIIYRLRKMAQGWATYGSTYYNNSSLLTSVKNGLDWFYNNRYNENKTEYDNWWYWRIGIPSDLNAAVVMVYSQLSPQQITNYMNAVDNFTPDCVAPDGWATWSGYNRAAILMIIAIRGIIVKDTNKIQYASDEMSVDKYGLFSYIEFSDLQPGDMEGGYLEDGSFIQHYSYLYTGDYGKHNIYITAELMWLLAGSTWENTSSDRSNVFDFYYRVFEPELYKMQLLESGKGRTASRYYYSPVDGSMVIDAGLMLAEVSYNPDAAMMKGKLKYHLQNGYQDLYFSKTGIWNIDKAKNLINDGSISAASQLTGNFQLYNSDRVVHRRSGWIYDVAMHSSRISNFETNGGAENLKGWYSSDGMTYLYQDARDYSLNFWVTVDPHRLPGTTVDRYTSRPGSSDDYKKSPNSWVGGVSLEGTYGTAGMHFTQHDYSNMDVTAKKSWFMFDDEVVALGTGIKSTSGRTIETIIENRPLNSAGDNELKVNGTTKSSSTGWSETMSGVNYAYLEGTGGFVFPGGATVKGLREYREGNSYDINHWYYVAANDEFNSQTLNGSWRWVRKDSSKYSLPGTSVDITTQTGTIEGSTNTTKNLMLANTPQHDMYIDAKLTFSPSANEQEAGIMFYLGDNDYLKISRVYTANGLKIKTVNEVNGSAASNLYNDSYGSTVYLKIEKSGTNYSLYASSNGTSWGSALTTFSNNMGGTDGFNQNLSMGMFAQNGNNGAAPQINASFDYFHVKQVRKYMTLWFDHGVDPTSGTYSYIVLPGKTASQVSDYNSSQNVSILKNTDKVQAVKETTLGITGANFWGPETADFITSYSASAVMVREQSSQLKVAVSDPTHKQKKITVELKKAGVSIASKDSTVTIKRLQPTIILEINVDGANGKTNSAVINYDSAITPGQPKGKLAISSATASTFASSYVAGNAKDGEMTTYWLASSDSYPQWLKLDLGSVRTVNMVKTLFTDNYDYQREYTYNIQVSSDDSSYTTVAGSTQAGGYSYIEEYFPSTSARYIKINTTACDHSPGYWAGIREVGVYNSELLDNNGFENTVSPWTGYWGTETVAQDSTYKYSGTYSCKISNRDNIACSAAQDIKNTLIEKGPGNYTLKAWVRLGSGTDSARPYIYYRDDAGDHWVGVNYTSANSSSFTECSGTVEISWTGALQVAKFYLYTQNTSPVTSVVYVDECSLIKNELLDNRGFEFDTVPWNAYWGTETLEEDSTYKHSGAYSCKVSDRDYVGCSPAQDIKDALLAKGQGNYTLKAWVRLGSGADSAKPYIYIKDDYGEHWYGSGSYTSVNSSTFTECISTANITWNGTLQTARFYMYTQETTPVAPVMYVDDCSLLKW